LSTSPSVSKKCKYSHWCSCEYKAVFIPASICLWKVLSSTQLASRTFSLFFK
jgi:hypothetical protein